jgi:hypothetical protein
MAPLRPTQAITEQSPHPPGLVRQIPPIGRSLTMPPWACWPQPGDRYAADRSAG